MKWSDKESTPEEQELILYLLSNQAKNELVELLEIASSGGRRWSIETLKICHNEGHCTSPRTAWREAPPRYCYECSVYKKGEMPLTPGGRTHTPNHENVEVEVLLEDERFKWAQELEVVCKENGRIVGYIDLICVLTRMRKYSAKITEGWTWKDFRTEEESFVIIIEAKPRVKVFQQVLRQMKTYRSFMPYGCELLRNIGRNRFYYVVATYEALPLPIIDAFKKEGIIPFIVPKPERGGQKTLWTYK